MQGLTCERLDGRIDVQHVATENNPLYELLGPRTWSEDEALKMMDNNDVLHVSVAMLPSSPLRLGLPRHCAQFACADPRSTFRQFSCCSQDFPRDPAWPRFPTLRRLAPRQVLARDEASATRIPLVNQREKAKGPEEAELAQRTLQIHDEHIVRLGKEVGDSWAALWFGVDTSRPRPTDEESELESDG
jgi:hypothetical protein